MSSGKESPLSSSQAANMRQQLDVERRLRQQAESKSRELKLENERCKLRLHELQRNFEGIQSQLRQMMSSQQQTEQSGLDKAPVQNQMTNEWQDRVKEVEKENNDLVQQLAMTKASLIKGQMTDNGALKQIEELKQENEELRQQMNDKQEQFDKTLSDITKEIVDTLTKSKNLSQEKKELEEKCEQLRSQNANIERKNQLLLKLLCRLKQQKGSAKVPESSSDLSHSPAASGRLGSTPVLETTAEGVGRRYPHMPMRSASLRSTLHTTRPGLRRSASGDMCALDQQLEVEGKDDISLSELNLSRPQSPGGTSIGSLSSVGSDMLSALTGQRHSLKGGETGVEHPGVGTRPPSLSEAVKISVSTPYHPGGAVTESSTNRRLSYGGLSSSSTSLTKLEGSMSGFTTKSIDSVTAERLRLIKRQGYMSADGNFSRPKIPATPPPPSENGILETDSSDEEEEDHINYVELWRRRSLRTEGDRGSSPLFTGGRPHSQAADTRSVISASGSLDRNSVNIQQRASSLPRDAHLHIFAENGTSSSTDPDSHNDELLKRNKISLKRTTSVVPGQTIQDAKGKKKESEVELDASMRANLLDDLVTSEAALTPPPTPLNLPSLHEAYDYLRCLRRKNNAAAKPFRGNITIIDFLSKGYFVRFDKPEEDALSAFTFLDTFQFVEPSSPSSVRKATASPSKSASPSRTPTSSSGTSGLKRAATTTVAAARPVNVVEKKRPSSAGPGVKRSASPHVSERKRPVSSTTRPSSAAGHTGQSSGSTPRSKATLSSSSSSGSPSPGSSARSSSVGASHRRLSNLIHHTTGSKSLPDSPRGLSGSSSDTASATATRSGATASSRPKGGNLLIASRTSSTKKKQPSTGLHTDL